MTRHSAPFLPLWMLAVLIPLTLNCGSPTPPDENQDAGEIPISDGGADAGVPDAGQPVCTPGTQVDCYEGPDGTLDRGRCAAGKKTCLDDGSGYGACSGQVLPAAAEDCSTPLDDDCNGAVNEGCSCVPGTAATCYTGPAQTENVGVCHGGTMTCNAQGTGYGPCTGEVVPGAESCTTALDDDCDGQVNEGCVCVPNTTESCYSGPAGTQGVGACRAGTRRCNAQGTGYGACTGEVLPIAESCATPADDNCDGQVNEGCPPAPSYATDAKPIFRSHCAPCHTTGGSGGHNIGTNYSDTQKPSNYCAGKTTGECALVRIQNGSMPQGAGCTGNPALDSSKPACLNAAEQATLQAWINGGMQP